MDKDNGNIEPCDKGEIKCDSDFLQYNIIVFVSIAKYECESSRSLSIKRHFLYVINVDKAI